MPGSRRLVPLVLALVERFAQTQEYDVIARAGGHALLAELPSLKADAAIVDLQMPDVGGFEILQAIRETHPTCEVILDLVAGPSQPGMTTGTRLQTRRSHGASPKWTIRACEISLTLDGDCAAQ